jgi:hypothetical protein
MDASVSLFPVGGRRGENEPVVEMTMSRCYFSNDLFSLRIFATGGLRD